MLSESKTGWIEIFACEITHDLTSQNLTKITLPNIANKVMRLNSNSLLFSYKDGSRNISNYIFKQIFVMQGRKFSWSRLLHLMCSSSCTVLITLLAEIWMWTQVERDRCSTYYCHFVWIKCYEMIHQWINCQQGTDGFWCKCNLKRMFDDKVRTR